MSHAWHAAWESAARRCTNGYASQWEPNARLPFLGRVNVSGSRYALPSETRIFDGVAPALRKKTAGHAGRGSWRGVHLVTFQLNQAITPHRGYPIGPKHSRTSA